jgi:hypothetical protein
MTTKVEGKTSESRAFLQLIGIMVGSNSIGPLG